jgi:D-glycero-D-manno-heptose 1,7-bisphosphate phosphatase
MIPALFLDRDGVINVDTGYAHRAEHIRFVDGIFQLCRVFQASGFALVVITNQAGVARGYYSEDDVRALHAWMSAQFARRGVTLTGAYYCPHHPEGTLADLAIACDCRKPQPGMILRAQRELDLDLSASVLIGDRESDIQAGINAGIPINLKMESAEGQSASRAAAVLPGLAAAVHHARHLGILPKSATA